VIAEVSKRAGLDTGVLTSSMAFAQLVRAVPFYDGLTLEAIGGRGVRWPETDAASKLVAGGSATAGGVASDQHASAEAAPSDNGSMSGALRLGTYRPIWAAPEVEISPALRYPIAEQQVELSPEDARRLGITSGERVEVAQNGTRLNAKAAVRSGVQPGTAFLATGIAEDSANELTEPFIEVIKP
jgi:NADH-quinone oxidoreductase subunit G